MFKQGRNRDNTGKKNNTALHLRNTPVKLMTHPIACPKCKRALNAKSTSTGLPSEEGKWKILCVKGDCGFVYYNIVPPAR
mgnify:FL=1